MPTEVLVMCTRCGRPQPARKGNCVACGEVLPDAPLPAASAPEAPFFLLEGTGGRSVTGVDRKLTYRPGASAAPSDVELGNLFSAVLVRHLFWEPLVLVPVAFLLGLIGPPSVRLVAVVLGGLGMAMALLWQRYSLRLKLHAGGGHRWSLGLMRMGSQQAHTLETAWSSGAQALASHRVMVMDSSEPPGPRA